MKCITPFRRIDPATKQIMDLPCRNCYACQANARRDWQTRLEIEAKAHRYNYFLTLTYDDENVPLGGFDGNTPTFSIADWEKFLKDFRNLLPPRTLRYYAVSHYGPETHRPHYHCLCFCDVPVTYEDVRKLWKYSGRITFTVAQPYRIRYITKNHIGGSKGSYTQRDIDRLGILNPFQRISKGLGRNLLTPAMKRYVLVNSDRITFSFNGTVRLLPEYLRKKLLSPLSRQLIGRRAEQKFISERQYRLSKDPLYDLREICSLDSKIRKYARNEQLSNRKILK